MTQRREWMAPMLIAACLAGCYGGVAEGPPDDPQQEPEGEAEGEAEDDGSSGHEPEPGGAACSPSAPTPLRRLTPYEYERAVRDLFGVSGSFTSNWLEQSSNTGFDNDVEDLSTQLIHVEQFARSADRVADAVVGELGRLLPCAAEPDPGSSCGEAFIDDYVPRAYRRPLTAADREALVGLLEAGIAASSFEEGLSLVVAAVMQSPDFLYRIEVGDRERAEGGYIPLTDFEIAARLSFFLWGTIPDQALFDRAAAGELHTPAQIEAMATQMLDAPQSRATIAHFHEQWFELAERLAIANRDPALFPGFDDVMREDLRAGLAARLEHVYLDSERGDLEELFQSDEVFVTANTAPLYGIEGIDATEPVAARSPADQRSGVLTDAALMTALSHYASSNPIARGGFVREALLCLPLPPPPTGDVPELEDSADLNPRELLELHRADPKCASCHRLMDPLGITFEHYDAVGRYRTEVGGSPVDVSTEIEGTQELDGPIDGAFELGQRLSQSELVSECIATRWFRYFAGRLETEGDQCAIEELASTLEQPDHQLRDLLIGVTQLHAFRHLSETEGTQCS